MRQQIRQSRRVLYLVAVLGLSLGLNLAYVFQARDMPGFLEPVNDGRIYDDMAREIVAGTFSDDQPFFQPPLFPYLLALIYNVVGTDVLRAKLVLALLLSTTPVWTFLLARQFMDLRPACISGLICAAWGPLIFFNAELLPAGLAALLGTMLLVALLYAEQRQKWWAWLVAGIVGGLATLTVATFLLVNLAVVGWLVLRQLLPPRAPNRCWAPAGLLLLGVAVCIAPVTLRNHRVSGQWVLVSANGGINLYLSNNENSMETMAIRPGLDWDYLERSALREGARNSAEADRLFMRKTLVYMAAEPVHFVQTTARKMRLLAGAREIPRTTDVYMAREFSALMSVLVWQIGPFALPWGIALPLAVLGLLPLVKMRRYALLMLLFVLVYGGAVALFFVSARHRLPLVPVMCVFAAWALRDFWAYRRSPGRTAVMASVFLVLGILVSLPVRSPADATNVLAETHLLLGIKAASQLDHGEEERQYRLALELDPDYAEVFNQLGTRSLAEGRLNEAIEALLTAVEKKPDFAEAHSNLGMAFEYAEMPGAAMEQYGRAVELRPWLSLPHFNLARLFLASGDAQSAVDSLRMAIRADVMNLEAANMLAWILATHPEESIRAGDEAVRFAEAVVQATSARDFGYLDTLAAAYAEAAQFDRAAATQRRVLSLAEQSHADKDWLTVASRRMVMYGQGKPWRDSDLQGTSTSEPE